MSQILFTNPYSGAQTILVETACGQWEHTFPPTVPVLQSWSIRTLDQIEKFLGGSKGFVVTHADPYNNATFFFVAVDDIKVDMDVDFSAILAEQSIKIRSANPVSWNAFLARVRIQIPESVPLSSIEVKVGYKQPRDHNKNGEFAIALRRADPWR